MKEELTTKMHSEFTVSQETEKKHKVWSAIEFANLTKQPINEVLVFYKISVEDYEKYKNTVSK